MITINEHTVCLDLRAARGAALDAALGGAADLLLLALLVPLIWALARFSIWVEPTPPNPTTEFPPRRPRRRASSDAGRDSTERLMRFLAHMRPLLNPGQQAIFRDAAASMHPDAFSCVVGARNGAEACERLDALLCSIEEPDASVSSGSSPTSSFGEESAFSGASSLSDGGSPWASSVTLPRYAQRERERAAAPLGSTASLGWDGGNNLTLVGRE